ncbi:MAG: RNA polymerase sigma factor [Bacteroidales bacterium]|nr:MAG: RNA polymerase sigma factor [Bacteroidales bacterium]
MTDTGDKELLLLFRNKDNREYAFGQIIRKYQERLYWHIRKIVIVHDDTDDVIQNTFIKAWSGLDKFREASQLYTWLYRIATNEALNFIKKKRIKLMFSADDLENYLANTLEEDVYFNGDEIQMKLQKAILALPDKQRIVFNMRYFDEMKYEDMAKILETSVGALKASYHHAVKKIEKILARD